MKLACTGPHGRIGKLLVGLGVAPLECDVTKSNEIEGAIKSAGAEVVAHLDSKSGVEFCEDPKNQNAVIEINFKGTLNVLKIAERLNVKVVVLSSDHIFDGKRGNYKEDNISHINPVNYYGHTKLAVEAETLMFDNAKIIRTSTLFNEERGLVKQYLDPLKEGKEVKVPNFLYRNFLYLPHFAELFLEYLNRYDEMPKRLHIAGGKSVSWFDFVVEMAKFYDIDDKLVRSRNYEILDYVARRPHRSGLNVTLSKQLGFKQYSYIDGLRKMREDSLLKELGYA